MGNSTITRRTALLGVVATAPTLWIPACTGKPRAAAKDTAAQILQHLVGRATRDGNNATLTRVFPSPQLANLDPFVRLDDFDVRVAAGFPDHPHRGLEAFTYMIDGVFHHRDNLGNDSTIGSGGTQRFNSGAGARHSEMPGTKGSNRGLQLWVNLPRHKKMVAPGIAGTDGDKMPVDVHHRQRVHTIVGPTSPVALHTEITYVDVTLLERGTFDRTIAPGMSTLLYVRDEVAAVGSTAAQRGEALILAQGELQVRGQAGTRFAYLQGRPHNEPIFHHGPFVD